LKVKAHVSLAMVPLVILSIASGATLSIWNEKMSVAYDVSAFPPSMENHSVIFLGISSGSNPILDMIDKTTTNITLPDNLSVLSTADKGNCMVLIDGEWVKNQNHSELVSAVSSLIVEGVPLVIINGDNNIIREAIEGDQHIGYMTSISSNPLHSTGIHYDAAKHCGESYAYSSIDGDLALAGMNAYTWCAQFLIG
jgi:hypothetical protein